MPVSLPGNKSPRTACIVPEGADVSISGVRPGVLSCMQGRNKAQYHETESPVGGVCPQSGAVAVPAQAHKLRWRVAGGIILEPTPFLVAGIVNVTPDSFSDGGCFFTPEAAHARVCQVISEGAHMVDLGAESTRPGAQDIGHAEEWKRLEPVLAAARALRVSGAETQSMGGATGGDTFVSPLQTNKASTQSKETARGSAEAEPVFSPAPKGLSASFPFAVSVDTFRAQTAALALEPGWGGADVINDVSGGSFDPGMEEVLASCKPGYVLGHCPALPACMQQNLQYNDVVDELLAWFALRMNALVKAGLPEECIVLDPCIGFGKNLKHTIGIIAAIPRFATLGRPLYFGISRKSFLGAVTGLPLQKRDCPTQVAVALLARAGVAIHRVHEVAQTVATLKLVHAFCCSASPLDVDCFL